MDTDKDGATISEALADYRAGRISRRTLVRLLRLTAAGAALGIGQPAQAAMLQDGTPAVSDEPPPAATPVLGEQPDGTRVWRVQAGAIDEAEMVEAMGFFPAEITINAGDAVFFDFGPRFHTATFLSGGERPRLILWEEEAGGTPVAGGRRAVINPAAGFPVGDTTYDGTAYLNSGTPDPTAPPFVVTFTATGTFDYLCLVHPQMKAKVIVQEAGTAPPMDQAAYDQLGTEQAEAMLKEGRALIAQQGAATPATGDAGAVHEVAVGVESHA
ncbi:MAG: hypothetical protein QOF01_2779, partial [Thermomicrobiales bacterium]|nr:hypothetical protein [Thermomicrobiales bacterium]